MPGAPGMKMYSREELMNMKNLGEDAGDEEDEEEEEQFSSNLVLIKTQQIKVFIRFLF